MDDDQRRLAWQTQTEAIYRAIGEFVVKFEIACFSISLCVQAILERSGLRNQQVTSILLAGITAEPLRALIESLSAETGWLTDEEREELKKLLSRFQKLTAERNDVIHGTWLIDFGNYATHQQNFSKAIGLKYHKNKDGSATKLLEKNVEDLKDLIVQAVELRTGFDRLRGRFIFDRQGSQLTFLPPSNS